MSYMYSMNNIHNIVISVYDVRRTCDDISASIKLTLVLDLSS